ncbi:MAG: GNAT family N-acetyltransferase [Solirubrobacteraceae bacterium]|jgi:RimJ/RimL family protein N-acetyltransferase
MRSWPLFALIVRTPRISLRLASDDELDVLATAAAGRVLPAAQADFMATGWTQLPSPAFERNFMQFHWKARGDWRPESWSLQLVAFDDAQPIGGFGLTADDFTQARTVETGSWLLPEWRGRGLGTEARAALLHLAFAELGAHEALSAAHKDNAASLGVSAALGYEQTGVNVEIGPSGKSAPMVQVRLDSEAWRSHNALPVDVIGLDQCRDMFGPAVAFPPAERQRGRAIVVPRGGGRRR